MKEKWKVYIKGVPYRGDENIKVLVDIGGRNEDNLFNAENDDYIFYINHKGDIDCAQSDSETAQIIMDNYREIKLPEWKDGDILINNDESCYKVFSEYGTGTDVITTFFAYNMSISVNGTITDYKVGVWVCDIKDYRLATPSEVEHFYKLLHASNKDWDAEKKQLINLRWKPKVDETYWVVYGNGHITSLKWVDFSVGTEYFDFGNCFKTKEDAEIAAEKIKKLLKGEQL